MYNVVGQMVKSTMMDNNMLTIDRDKLATGMYLYEVLRNGNVIGKGKIIAE